MPLRQLLRISLYVLPIGCVLFQLYRYFDSFWFHHLSALILLPLIAWILGNWTYDCLNTETIAPEGKAVLITGCDSGFGNALAKRLACLGFHVYAGVLFPEGPGAVELTTLYPQNIELLKLDVTSQAEVESAVATIKRNSTPLWAVVNNAGIALSCPWDWGTDVEEYKRMFEVNTFGTIRVAKNTAPLLRQTSGRLVNVASAAGRLVASQLGHYSLSKFAVRAFSDAIRRDTLSNDLQVITIEPAFYRTSIVNARALNEGRNRIRSQTPPEVAAYYGKRYERFLDRSLQTMELLMHEDVDEVVDQMVRAVTAKYPKIYYRCTGWLTYGFVWIGSMLPEILVDSFMYFVFRLY